MPAALALILLVVVVILFLWLSFQIMRLILMLFIAGLVGWLADEIIPGRLPWGWLGAILAGLVGSWVGVALIGHKGPDLFGIPLLPAFVGALILAVVVNLVAKLTAGSRTP